MQRIDDHPFAPYEIVCDNCGKVEDLNATNWKGAFAKAKSRGWCARLEDEEWIHLCEDCNGSEDS